MANDSFWHGQNMKPDLSRLPREVRESLTAPIPLRPEEGYATVVVYQRTPALSHANARCNTTFFKRDENSFVNIETGVQLDFTDYTGRIPLATAVLGLDVLKLAVTSMIRVFVKIGGNLDEVLAAAKQEVALDGSLMYNEERNDE